MADQLEELKKARAFKVGENLATTPGAVVFRSRFIGPWCSLGSRGLKDCHLS
jgi:poly(3-hydroxyalkanoate) synthetase